MLGMGHWEILMILVVVLLLFGAKRIPEMAQGLGKGIREFRKAVKDVQEEITLPEGESSSASIDPKTPENQVVRQGTESGKDKTQN